MWGGGGWAFESGNLLDLRSPLVCHGNVLDQEMAQPEAYVVRVLVSLKKPSDVI